MHYYHFNIADYRKDTTHLLPIEHYIYRTLIDWYYLDETPIPKETQVVIRRLRLDTQSIENINFVLNDFFKLQDDGWHHLRIDSDIRDYQAMVDKNKTNGKLGGRPKKTQVVNVGLANNNPSESQINPNHNHKPITNNHKPIKNNIGYRLPDDWIAPQEFIEFCNSERPDLNANDVALQFHDYWISVPGAKGLKTNWLATWRNWVRRQEASKSKHKNKSQIITDQAFEEWLEPKGFKNARIG